MRFPAITYSPVIALLLLSVNAFPQQQDEYFFSQIKNEDGLSQSTVRAIIQDREGYMWFGTANGLNRYDGYTFKVYNSDSKVPGSISGMGVASIYEDKAGYIWVGTNDGWLNKYNRITDSFEKTDFVTRLEVIPTQTGQYYEYPISFSRNNDNAINTITEDDSGYLWLGTWGKGVVKYNKKNGSEEHFFNHPNRKESLSSNRIMDILVDRDKNIWVGTFGGGLNKLLRKPGEEPVFIKYKQQNGKPAGLSDNKIISLFEDTDGDIWIGTYNGGLNKITAQKGPEGGFRIFREEKNNPNSIGNNIVMTMIEDRSGYLWIGTFGGGLNRYEKTTGRFIHFKNTPLDENSIADNDVLSLCEDSSGIIWIGTHLGQGISTLQKNKIKFRVLKKNPLDENSLSDDVVWSVTKDNSDNVWIGTYKGGLNKYDRKKDTFTVFSADPLNSEWLSDNHIRALEFDKQGNLWIGTYSSGLNKYVPSENKFYSFQHNPADRKSIGANQVLKIHIDADGVFWIATFGGGLEKFIPSRNEFIKYMNDPADDSSIGEDRVYTLCEDHLGNIWVGTFGGGLEKFNKSTGKFIHYKHNPENENSLSYDRVMAVYEDTNGIIWIGTFGGGLNKFDPAMGKFVRFGVRNGLTSDVVYGILEDKEKNLWISSDNGIFKLNLRTEVVSHYDIQDGLQGLEYSGGAYFESPDGEIFFGGIKGLNYFHPENIYENKYIPPVVITGIKQGNDRIPGKPVDFVLAHNQNFISFEFSALDYSYPQDNHYQYKLEGLDEEWHYTSSAQRIASYTNLSPGSYVFSVRGSNNDDFWNMKGASFAFTIQPPFWRTWWFMSAAVVLIALVLYYLSTIKIRNQLVIERLKTKLAADLHDNVGSGLTEISILSELAKGQVFNGGTNELKHISEISRQLVDNMSDIVWVVNPKRDSVYDLIVRLKDGYSEMLASMGISFKTNNLEKLTAVKLPMEYRQNLFLIFKEGINNSIKHSGCSKITLETNLRGDVLEILLADDGKGFELKDKSRGNGLKNMEQRADEIGGKLKIRGKPGDGTTVTFLGKVPKSFIGFRKRKLN